MTTVILKPHATLRSLRTLRDGFLTALSFALILFPLNITSQVHNFPWPMAPMNVQHRISATFDECREDRDHFHNGTDIPLAPNEEALNIMAGQVLGFGSDWIRVEDFAYVHVIPNPALLQVGTMVSQGGVVGWADSYAHIHLNYGGGGTSGHPTGNPLLPTGLVPFSDPYHPRSPIIQFALDGTSAMFPNNSISGRVDIIAQAADTTDLRSSIDMNNGIYTIGWALHSADTSEILTGPHFWFEADELYSNSYINNVYAPGSSTSIYKYIVTNRVYSNGYLDCDLYEPGPYVISVMSSDSRGNWDTTYVRVNISDIDLLPPGQPILNYVGPDDNGDLYLEWTPPNDADLAGYILEFSFDGESWVSNHGPDVITSDMNSFTVLGFPQNSYIKFRLIAVDAAPIPNRSDASDAYGVSLDHDSPAILIVDGFDRIDGSWHFMNHDFACYYSDAVVGSGVAASITTVSNEWVVAAEYLDDYETVIWFIGDDSRTDETFSTAEQSVISAYLSLGGNFFASGAEIAYDLSAGSAGDEAFMNQMLHIAYAGDNAASLSVNGLGPHFSGLGFNYGTEPYQEDWPDYFTPVYGGWVALQYGNIRNAAIRFKDDVSATFTMGFAFETIDTETARIDLMTRVLQFFASPVSIENISNPLSFSISRAYPNPFNASVNLNYSLEYPGDVTIAIYDISGREVLSHKINTLSSGIHEWQWHGLDNTGHNLSSGAYMIRLFQNGHQSAVQKVLLIK